MDRTGHGFSHFRRSRWFAKVSIDKENALVNLPLHFKLELNTVGPLSVPSDINLKDGGGVNVRADLEKQIFANILIRTFFLIWCGESLLISFQGL
jgi:hypothetical protein